MRINVGKTIQRITTMDLLPIKDKNALLAINSRGGA